MQALKIASTSYNRTGPEPNEKDKDYLVYSVIKTSQTSKRREEAKFSFTFQESVTETHQLSGGKHS